MRRHGGTLIVAAALLVAAVVHLAIVVPARQECATLTGRILAQGVESLEARLARAPDTAVAALVELDGRLEEVFPDPADALERLFGREGVPAASTFQERFSAWLARLQGERILERGAWPSSPWLEGDALPTPGEMRSTARLALLVEGLATAIRDRGGSGHVVGIAAGRTPGEVEITLNQDPERAGAIVDVVSLPTLGGEPFELVSLHATVQESGRGVVWVRLRALDEEPR